MFTLYHNLETEDGLRCDGVGAKAVVREAFKMWKEERKAIIFEIVLEKNNEIYYDEGGSLINEKVVLIEAEGHIPPRTIREAAIVVKRFLERTKETRGLLSNVSKVDAALKNDARLDVSDQMQAVIDCLYADGEEKI